MSSMLFVQDSKELLYRFSCFQMMSTVKRVFLIWRFGGGVQTVEASDRYNISRHLEYSNCDDVFFVPASLSHVLYLRTG